MAFKLDSFIAPAASRDDSGLRESWDERLITAVAVAMAVLIVATVAVLMGMA